MVKANMIWSFFLVKCLFQLITIEFLPKVLPSMDYRSSLLIINLYACSITVVDHIYVEKLLFLMNWKIIFQFSFTQFESGLHSMKSFIFHLMCVCHVTQKEVSYFVLCRLSHKTAHIIAQGKIIFVIRSSYSSMSFPMQKLLQQCVQMDQSIARGSLAPTVSPKTLKTFA